MDSDHRVLMIRITSLPQRSWHYIFFNFMIYFNSNYRIFTVNKSLKWKQDIVVLGVTTHFAVLTRKLRVYIPLDHVLFILIILSSRVEKEDWSLEKRYISLTKWSTPSNEECGEKKELKMDLVFLQSPKWPQLISSIIC